MACVNWSGEGAPRPTSVYGTELVWFVGSTATHLTQRPTTEDREKGPLQYCTYAPHMKISYNYTMQAKHIESTEKGLIYLSQMSQLWVTRWEESTH